jgi:hypothetical protein
MKKRLFSSILFRRPNFVGRPTKVAIFVGFGPIFVGFWPMKLNYFPVVLVPVVTVLTAPVAHRRASDGVATLVVATAWRKEEGEQ